MTTETEDRIGMGAILLVLDICLFLFGQYNGKRLADRWWQKNEDQQHQLAVRLANQLNDYQFTVSKDYVLKKDIAKLEVEHWNRGYAEGKEMVLKSLKQCKCN